MTKEELKIYQDAAMLGLIPDEENPIFLFSMTRNVLLVSILKGDIDAKEMARMALANRGYDETGKFVGWKAAKSE